MYNNLILPVQQGGLFGARNSNDKTCIGDMYLSNYTQKYIKQTRNRNKITCVCETCISSMLLKLDLNKCRLSKFSKLDKLYTNYASTRILQRAKIDFIEYNNQIFPNNAHIHLRAYDAASSYDCTYIIIESKVPKWDCIVNCFYCPGINVPDLE